MTIIPNIWRDVSSLSGTVNFTGWFGNDRPVEIEIGCGKGAFLMGASDRFPDVNFIGVEKEGKYLKRARMKAERQGVENIRLIHGDMVYFLMNHLPDNSVQAYHIYFPDPWPKRRHGKRRMFRDVSVGEFARTLVPEGKVHMKTDLPINFSRIRRVVNDSELFELETMTSWPAGQAPADNIPTNFEIKYGRIGKETFRAVWRLR